VCCSSTLKWYLVSLLPSEHDSRESSTARRRPLPSSFGVIDPGPSEAGAPRAW